MSVKKLFKGSAFSILLFVLAALLLLTAGISGARAALNARSQTYQADLKLQDLAVTLQENGTQIGANNNTGVLLQNLNDGNAVCPGVAYDEVINVRNVSNTTNNQNAADIYVRVVVTRCWLDDSGKPMTELDPSYIDLGEPGDGWVEDTSARTAERSVYYYTGVLQPGEETPPLFKTLTISDEVDAAYSQASFRVTAETDAVQQHNAQSAILSSWGVRISIADNGTLSLG